jgi:transposase-like protein
MILATLVVYRMAKSLCKWKKKDIEHNIHELTHIVDKPRFICKDCARAAHDKNFLCKPMKLK